ncbi:MAG: tautomerase family protein [Beijerinckiaceae bacterium]
MPILNVQLSGSQSSFNRIDFARNLTELTTSHLKKDPALTALILTVTDPADWWIGTQSLQDQGLGSFALNIKVTAGTNTKAEMSMFIETVFAYMCALLGKIHPASYVVIDEVPGAAWGYGGLTQEHRFIAARLAKAA